MPYRYSNYRRPMRRRYTPRRTFRSRAAQAPAPGLSGMTVGQAAVGAYRLASSIAGIVNSELKHYDENNTLNPDANTGASVSIIRGMAQGTTNNTIDGNSILAKRLNVRGTIQLGTSATTTRVRLAIVWDTRPSTTLGTIPAWTDVFDSATINCLMNLDDQIKRFRILHDKTYVVNSVSLAERPFALNYKFSRHIKFTDAQVPNLNDIIVLALSDESTNVPAVSFHTRIRYYDN